MKFFIDLLPVVIFFIVYKYTDIFYATFSAIIVSIFLAISTYLIKKKIEKMVLFNTLLITILGGLTMIILLLCGNQPLSIGFLH